MKLKNLRKKIRRLEKRLQEGSKEAGQAKRETEGGRGSKGNESREEIGRPHDCNAPGQQAFSVSRSEEVTSCQESEKKIESLTGTPCATCGCDESQVGSQESR